LVRLCVLVVNQRTTVPILPRYDRERYKNFRDLDILPTYPRVMSKTYRRRANTVLGLK